jgi:CheY-like chemotaxis protein
LTSRGEAEIRGAKTTLTPLALELLVRTDGRTTVDQLQASMSEIPSQQVTDTLAKLLHHHLIDYTDPRDDVLRLDDIKGIARTAARAHALDASARQEAAVGFNSLKHDGFYVRIARRPEAQPKLPRDRAPQLLIVEDEPHLARFLSHFMRFEGFEVRVAGDRDAIVEALREGRPDLVLLDVMLPDANGFDVLARIRQHPSLSDLPVVMMTSIATREAVIKGLACGADGYVTKPFQVHLLVKAIQTIFGLAHDRVSDPWEHA